MDLRRVKWLALLVPAVGLIGFEVFRHRVLHGLDDHPSPHLQEHVVSATFLFVGVVAFTFVIFRILERLHGQLVALNEAGMAVTGELSPDRVLQRVAQLASTVARAPHVTVRVDANTGRNVSAGTRPPIGESLELPIVVRGRRLGQLVLTAAPRRRFRFSDRAALETFATQAGIALENARLYEEVRELAALRERARIGMDLHDGVIQELYALGLKIEDTTGLVVEDPDQAVEGLRAIHRGIRSVIGDVRSYVYDLRDGDGSVDVGEALDRLVAEFRGRLAAIEVETEANILLSAGVAANVVQVVREALANAMRHAKPTTVRVACLRQNGSVEIAVQDDGCGFDPTVPASGLGIEDMRRRAGWSGGHLVLSTQPGRGTTVRLRIPTTEETTT